MQEEFQQPGSAHLFLCMVVETWPSLDSVPTTAQRKRIDEWSVTRRWALQNLEVAVGCLTG